MADILNTTDTSAELTIGTDFTSYFETEDWDEDWIKVNLDAGKSYAFEIDTDSNGWGYLNILDSNGNYEYDNVINTEDNTNNAEVLLFTPSESGTYYLDAEGSSWDDNGSEYTIKSKTIDLQPDNFADSISDAVEVNSFPYSSSQSLGDNSSISDISDIDYFKLDLKGGQTYKISIGENFDINFVDNNGDYYWDSSTMSYAWDDTTNSEIILVTPTQDSTYYLKVDMDDLDDVDFNNLNTLADYNLQIDTVEPDAIGNTISTAADFNTLDTNKDGTLNSQDDNSDEFKLDNNYDTDMFKVNVEAGKTYEIYITSDNDSSYQYVDLIDNNGDYQDTNWQWNDSLDDYVQYFTADSNGTYYLDVEGDQGNYELTFKEVGSSDTEDDHPNNINGDFSNSTFDFSNSNDVSLTGTLGYSDEDYFKLNATAGESYEVILSSSDSYPYVDVLDSNGNYTYNNVNYVWDDSDLDNNVVTHFYFTPNSDETYYLDVEGSTGDYTLEVKETDVQADDHANSISQVSDNDTLSIGDAKDGQLETSYDVDYFKVSLQANQTYTIKLSSDNDDFYPTVDLYDANGNSEWNVNYTYNYDDSDVKDEFTFTPSTAGNYYLEVSGYESGSYEIEVDQVQADDHPDNINGDFSNSTFDFSNSNDVSMTGNFNSYGDEDYFKLNAEAGDTFIIKFKSDDDLYPDIEVMDSNGNYQSIYWSWSSDADETYTFTANTKGDYYIDLDGYNTGDYTLEVIKESTSTDDHANSIDAVTDNDTITLDNGSATVSGNIDYYSDEDYFKLSVQAGKTYQISVDNSNIDMNLMDSNGNYLWDVNYSWNNNAESLTYTADENGNIYLDVDGWELGSYNITVKTNEDDHANSIDTVTDNDTITLDNGSASVNGKIDYYGDDDYLKLSVQAGKSYDITLNSDNHETYLDLLENSDGYENYIWNYDYVWDNNDEHIVFTASTTEDIYLDVEGEDTTNYTLNVSEVKTSTDDHANSIDAVTDNDTITLNNGSASVNGKIDYYGDDDYLKLSVQAGKSYDITLNSDNHETYLDLLENSDGYENYIWNYDYVWDNNDEHIVFTASTTEDIYLDVEGEDTTNYTLNVSEVETSTDDHANNIDAVTDNDTITLDNGSASVNGKIDYYGDNDYLKLSVEAGKSYDITLNSDNHETYLDLLENSDGYENYIWNYDYVWDNNDEHIVFTASTTEDIYLDVEGEDTTNYTLNVSEVENNDVADNTSTTAQIQNNTYSGKIDTYNDVDWIKVDVKAGETYQVDVTSDDIDTIIEGIYDNNGNYIDNTYNDDANGTLNSETTFAASTTGTYYIAVSGYDTGDYTVNVKDIALTDAEANNINTNATVTVGQYYQGKVDYAYDEDWIKVSLDANKTYEIDLNGVSLDDTVINGIYDSTGKYINGTFNDDTDFSLNSSVTFTANTSGDYYISVGGFADDTGTYQLNVKEIQNTNNSNTDTQAHDINNTLDSAISLDINTPTNGTIDYDGDVDFYKVHLEAGQTYDIKMLGNDNDNGTLIDPLIKGVLDSNGNLIDGTYTDDSFNSLDSDLKFTADTTGDYYIEASSFSGEGTFKIQVNQEVQQTQQIDNLNKGDLTIMVYLAADNNLSSYALEDINEMEAANLPNNVHVTFMMDGNDSYVSSDWAGTKYGVISHDDDMSTINSYTVDEGEKDSGDPSTLTDFINWSANIAPSDNYVLVDWDHGGGIAGTAWDDTSNDDNLTINELQSAIQNSNVSNFGMVGFDACLEGVLDSSYSLKDNADYVVGSENTEPGDGWDYTTWLNDIANDANNNQLTNENIAKDAVSSYGDFYTNENVAHTTLSAVKTSALDTIVTDLKNFNDALSLLDTSEINKLKEKIGDANTYGIYNDYVDLGSLAKAADDLDFTDKQDSNGHTFDDYAHQLYTDITAQDGVVAANFSYDGGDTGISIYDPGYDDSDYVNNYEIAQLTNIDDLYQI